MPKILTFYLLALLVALMPVLAILKDRAVPPLSNDPASIDQLRLFAQYSAAAYCKSVIDSSASTTKVRCSVGNCPLVEAADTVLLYTFDGVGGHDIAGFLAVDQTNEFIVLSFRGTIKELQNLLDDGDAVPVSYWRCDACLVHQGFLQSWQVVSVALEDALFSNQDSYAGYPIVVTGHSYGAAVATIAAEDIRKFFQQDVYLYTYGSPAVGNEAFADFVMGEGLNFRVTHLDDPVPRVPPLFYHVNPEYWITSGNGVPVTSGDIQYLPNGGGDIGGLDGDLAAHDWYFDSIDNC